MWAGVLCSQLKSRDIRWSTAPYQAGTSTPWLYTASRTPPYWPAWIRELRTWSQSALCMWMEKKEPCLWGHALKRVDFQFDGFMSVLYLFLFIENWPLEVFCWIIISSCISFPWPGCFYFSVCSSSACPGGPSADPRAASGCAGSLAGPSGRLERLLADLGAGKLNQLLRKALHCLRLLASDLSFNASHTPCTEQSSVCVSDLQLWPRRRDMLHCREVHGLAELNISISFFFLNFCNYSMLLPNRFGSLEEVQPVGVSARVCSNQAAGAKKMGEIEHLSARCTRYFVQDWISSALLSSLNDREGFIT